MQSMPQSNCVCVCVYVCFGLTQRLLPGVKDKVNTVTLGRCHVFFFHSNLTLGALGALVSDNTDMYNSNAPKPVQSDIDLSDI